MIRPFADHDTEAPFRTEENRRCSAIARVAYRLSLDFVWTRRSGNHRLPFKLNHNAMRYSHESPDHTRRNSPAGVSEAHENLPECEGAGDRGASPGRQ